jgi:hypothetical protein
MFIVYLLINILVFINYEPFSHISECTMYWFMAISSTARNEFKSVSNFVFPFIVILFDLINIFDRFPLELEVHS